MQYGDDRSAGPRDGVRQDLLWFVICFAVGVVGLFSFLVPLFGFLGFAGAVVLPFAGLAEIGFGIAAVVAGGRWRAAYLLGNLGLVAASGVIYVVGVIGYLSRPGWQPNTDVFRPLFFGVALMGLAGGITLGVFAAGNARQTK
jgi:predicted membrane channel-forming protein YqfA (hemolysin III family)